MLRVRYREGLHLPECVWDGKVALAFLKSLVRGCLGGLILIVDCWSSNISSCYACVLRVVVYIEICDGLVLWGEVKLVVVQQQQSCTLAAMQYPSHSLPHPLPSRV